MKNAYAFSPFSEIPCFKDHTRVVHKSSTNYTILLLKILPRELYWETTKEMILGMELPLSSSTQEESLLEGKSVEGN